MSLIPKKGTVYVVDDDEAVRDSLSGSSRAKTTVSDVLTLQSRFSVATTRGKLLA